MKKIALLMVLFVFGNMAIAQNNKKSKTGNEDFDKALFNLDLKYRKDRQDFKMKIIGKFNLTEEKVNEYATKYIGSDIYLILETANKSNLSIDKICAEVDKNRAYKTWVEMFTDLGIEKDDDTYNAIKDGVINNGLY